MGCSLISKDSNIKSSEVDLKTDLTKLSQTIKANDTKIENVNDSDNIIIIKNCSFKNNKKAQLSKIKNFKVYHSTKIFKIDNSEKMEISGPIFNFLKKNVDNYKKNNKIQ